ncbi:hypothetical protein TD95_005356 [Thielaviopsis punctulata]|uniref:Major facilitator superfamily (MFS) profile domain-containing protein n=1 Tax=Thielaviopsis punctulata TaxID=72032 RepID=A0A0F4Z868_9PEZI|nr:hypothetical protein TD95_005356 [Thielaviopsis punctulata]
MSSNTVNVNSPATNGSGSTLSSSVAPTNNGNSVTSGAPISNNSPHSTVNNNDSQDSFACSGNLSGSDGANDSIDNRTGPRTPQDKVSSSETLPINDKNTSSFSLSSSEEKALLALSKGQKEPPASSVPDSPFSVSCVPVSVSASVPAPTPASASPSAPALAPLSRGVARMKAINAVMTGRDTGLLFACILAASWAYGLDGTVRCTYQNYATGSFHQHSLLATVNVLRSVVATVAQPAAGKLANVIGRLELIGLAVIFYTAGTLIQALAPSMGVFSVGAVLYQIGYTLVVLLVEVLVGDSSSTRDRVWVSYIPALPFAVNTWVSGFIAEQTMKTLGWRWGIGVWAAVFPLSCLPLLALLVSLQKRAQRAGLWTGAAASSFSWKQLYEQMDVPGIVLIAVAFSLLLVPLTLAGGVSSSWGSPHIVVPLVLSGPALASLLYWEAKMARFPLIPMDALKNRAVWAPLLLALFLNLAWYMQGDYLYTSLLVCFNFSSAMAVMISSLYSFVGTVVGFLNGLLIRYVRRLKFSIIAGAVLMGVAFGLMTKFRGSPNSYGKIGIIICECVLGFAGALYPYPTQAALQAQLPHEHQSSMLGVYLAMYQIGSAAGNAISGMLWTQSLRGILMSKTNGNEELADAAFQDPITTALKYNIDTAERKAIISAVSTVQGQLCMVGGILCVPIFLLALMIKDVRLTDEQSVVDEYGNEKGKEKAAGSDPV